MASRELTPQVAIKCLRVYKTWDNCNLSHLGRLASVEEEWTINLPKYYILNYTRIPTYNYIPDTGI